MSIALSFQVWPEYAREDGLKISATMQGAKVFELMKSNNFSGVKNPIAYPNGY